MFIKKLIWNDRNVSHIARHEVNPYEVEEVCHSDPLIEETYNNRLLLIGPTTKKRMLGVVLERTDANGVYFPVTARPAKRKERRKYELKKEVKKYEKKTT